MSEAGRARILSIGTELTDGQIANTHLRFLGSQLKSLGFRVVGGEQVPDELELILASLARSAAEAELVLVTGGLGPTSDDLTREAVARAAGVALEFRPELWQRLLERYASGGQKPPESNRRQAFIPAGFQAIPNDWGTAPGFWGRLGGSPAASEGGRAQGALVAALPGPPAELEPMFAQRLVPLLAEHFPAAARGEELEATAVLIPESALEDALRRHRRGEVAWGTRVAEDRIAFRLLGGSGEEREAMLGSLQAQFGAARVRRGSLRPSESLLRVLEGRGERLALAESCTGGLASKMLTDIPGSSRVFWGGAATYSNDAKQRLLGVSPDILERYGAVSGEAALAMARGLLERSPAEMAVAITGIAGPEGGTPEKPVGTVWVCACHRDGRQLARRLHFPGGRDLVRRRSAVAGLLAAECLLAGLDFPAIA